MSPSTAVVHDWLPVYAGAERVLEQIVEVADPTDIYTLVDFLSEADRRFLAGRPVRTSFIQGLPFARRLYRHYLPFAPLAIEGFDLSGYDRVVSSSYAVAKGVLTHADQLHLSYVHSPVRYAWDLQFAYLRDGGMGRRGVRRAAARALLHYLRLFDATSASRVDRFVANSHHVARRIWKTYRRTADVVHPPVDLDAFPLSAGGGDHYVTVGRLVPYKRFDVVVEAFNAMPGRELVVIGDGPDLRRLEALAGPNVRVLGRQPAEALRYYLQNARGFVFAALEDFGIAPVEAMACGTPVLAYGRGGALETVRPGVSGLLFEDQSADSVRDGVDRFERTPFEREAVRAHAEQFSVGAFRRRFADVLDAAAHEFDTHGPASGRDGGVAPHHASIQVRTSGISTRGEEA